MTNRQRQKCLDKAKWLESEKQGHDMGGCMLYCQYCEHADHSHPTESGKCYASYEEMSKNCYCATAFNKLGKAKR